VNKQLFVLRRKKPPETQGYIYVQVYIFDYTMVTHNVRLRPNNVLHVVFRALRLTTCM